MGPERRPVRLQIIDDATEAGGKLPIDLGNRTGRKRLRDVREEGLEPQSLPEVVLRAAALRALHQQGRDQPALEEDQSRRRDHVPAVPLPYRWLLESNDTSRGQKTTVDAPPRQLPVVENGDRRAGGGRRRPPPSDHPPRQSRSDPARRLEVQHVTAHDPAADDSVGERVDRDGGSRGNASSRLVGDEITPGAIPQEWTGEYDGILRERGDGVEDVLQSPVDQVANLDGTADVRQLLPGRLQPQPLGYRRSHEHDRAPCAGVQTTGQIQSVPPAPLAPRAGDTRPG